MRSETAKTSASHSQEAAPNRVRFTLVLVVLPYVAMLQFALVNLPANLVGAEFERLPPVRLPLVRSKLLAPELAVADEMDDIVRLAGGAVELRVPQGWWIWEIPQGREVRVAFSPTRPLSMRKVPVSGYWVCFHLGPSDSSDPRQYLADKMRQRLIEVTDGRAQPLHAIQFQRLGPWDAAEMEFSLSVVNGGRTTLIQGSHVLVQTPWGLFEFHSQFPSDRYQEQLGETARLLQQIKLAAPTVAETGPAAAQANAAVAIHGTWKSFRSRLRLSSDGGIEIATDRPQVISPPVVENDQPAGPQLLRGHYRADGDLLFVQWQDGSKLNFRWKLNGRTLLLTDHAGQISQLRRIAE